MDNQILEKIDHYWQLVIKWRWLVIIPLIITLSAGMYKSVTVPRIYEARTLILVEPQRVPSKFVESIVDSNINSRVDTIKQQVLSRTSLENVINQFGLFSEPENENMFMEDKLESLRRRIGIEVTRARRGADAFEITFKGRDPEQVKNVANSLANSFININLKVREEKAIGTSNFLDGQLNDIRTQLIETEQAIKEYRREYMGELPEQLDANLKMLDRLQLKLNERFETLRNAKNNLRQFEQDSNKKVQEMEDQIARLDEQQDIFSGFMTDDWESEEMGMSKLDEIKKEYNNLLIKYTKNHPDVIRLQKQIEDLESLEQEGDEATDEKEPVVSEPTDVQEIPQELGAGTDNFFENQMRKSLDEMREQVAEERAKMISEIDAIEKEIDEIKSDMEEYQRRVDVTPNREQDLISLKRDYKNIQASYSSLLNRKLEAEIAVSMERKSKGEQFRIVDPAKRPQKPISPDVKKFLVLAVGAGLAIGGALIFLIDFFNGSIRKPDELENAMGIPVLASIPMIHCRRDYVFKWANICASAVFLMITFGLLSGFSLMALKGVDQTLELVKRFL